MPYLSKFIEKNTSKQDLIAINSQNQKSNNITLENKVQKNDFTLNNTNNKIKITKNSKNVECIVQKCPKTLVNELTSRFIIPDNINPENLSIIIFNVKTNSSMISYSPEVYDERKFLSLSVKSKYKI